VAVFGAGAVVTGALGAHALRGALPPASLETWNTAVRFQFWHVLALALAAVMHARLPGKGGQHDRIPIFALRTGATAFTLGIVLFCGSLYALALHAPHAVGLVTPLGGACLIVGWIALGVALFHRKG